MNGMIALSALESKFMTQFRLNNNTIIEKIEFIKGNARATLVKTLVSLKNTFTQ